MIRILKRNHIITLFATLVLVMMASVSAFAAMDETESNNTREYANRISMGTTVYGVSDDYDINGPRTGYDWFKFTAPVNGTAKVVIKADYLPYNFTSAELIVYNSNGEKLVRAYDDQSQWGGKAVQFGVYSGNTYYIKVYSDYANYCSPDAEYHFTVSYVVGKTAIKSATGAKKAVKVKWNKKSKASYYQVQYVRKSRYEDYGWNGAKIVKATKSYKTIKGLKKKTRYYVRVRVVRKINGVTYYSAWSAKKAVKSK